MHQEISWHLDQHRRYEKKREAQQKAAEDAKKQSDANVDAAGLRKFGAGQAEALEAAFKSETVRQAVLGLTACSLVA